MWKPVSFNIFPLSRQDRKILARHIRGVFTDRTASGSKRGELQRLIEAAKGVSKKKLKKLNNEKGKTVAYITAYRQSKSKKENKKRNSQMIRELQKSGVKDYYTLQGRYEEQETGEMKNEQTFLLLNPDLKDVMKAAEKFDQDSIIFKGKDNVIGMYNRLEGEVVVAKPGTEEVSVKDEAGDADYENAWTRFRSIGLNYDFVWSDPIKFDKDNPKPLSIEDLDKKGWLEKHNVNKEDFTHKGKSDYQKKKDDRGGKDRDKARKEFLNKTVKNPETGNDVKIKTLKGKPQDSKAYQEYLKLKKKWEKGS